MRTGYRPLILDLDFTLLHLKWGPNSIEVPGRTRSAWIAPRTVELLHALQSQFDIVLATARSWDGTRWVWDGLESYGVTVAAVVVEDGALLGQPGHLQALDPDFEVPRVRAEVKTHVQPHWPAFEWQQDFQGCLVGRCDDKGSAETLYQIFAAEVQWNCEGLRFYRDGRKVYLLPQRADKWTALQQLLEERAPQAAGVGDGENDVRWLKEVQLPCTLTGAVPAVVSLVQQKGGYLSPLGGHEGIQDVLQFLTDRSQPEADAHAPLSQAASR